MNRLLLHLLAAATILATSATAQEIKNQNYVPDMTFEQTINAMRKAQPGMSIVDATAALQDAGIRKLGVEAGDSFFWSAYFRLSENYQLVLDCTTTQRGPDKSHKYGRVTRAWVESVKDNSMIFELTDSPKQQKQAEQSGPAYPPQGVGSADP